MPLIYGKILFEDLPLVIFVLWHIHMEVLLYWNWFEIENCISYFIHFLFQATRYAPEFSRRVFAVALTDSPMKAYTKHFDMNVLRMLQKVCRFLKYFNLE